MTAISITARVASLFGPVRRLHDNVNQLNATVGALVRHQEHAAAERAALPGGHSLSAGTPDAELDRSTRRELGEAALRHLPFLLGMVEVATDCITVVGYCGAPEGITGQMAFFIDGQRIDDVDYPIHDPELKSKFPDVSGMGFAFRARIRQGLDALKAAKFWRLDASPTGHWNAADWRRSMHYPNPLLERFPFPPEANIKRVIGDTSTERFAMGGAIIFANLAAYLGEMGLGWGNFPQVLDWGCGAGRLTRYLISETPCAVTGVDIDADNIAWCQQAYPGGTFAAVPLHPPTGLQAGQFDLVVGLSVLTHLQEQDQFLWLQELQRITRPGALLFLSVSGPTQFAYNRFPPDTYRKLQAAGYMNLHRDGALDGVVSDTEYYRAAMHSRAYITQRWSQFFDVLAIADAIAALQDFVVLRRR